MTIEEWIVYENYYSTNVIHIGTYKYIIYYI